MKFIYSTNVVTAATTPNVEECSRQDLFIKAYMPLTEIILRISIKLDCVSITSRHISSWLCCDDLVVILYNQAKNKILFEPVVNNTRAIKSDEGVIFLDVIA